MSTTDLYARSKKVYGHIYGEKCHFVITASWLAVVQRRTARRGIPSDGSASCCVVPWYDAAIFLGLNTFGTLGHTCFALPEQPPCAPCFARTHSNSISAWTCTRTCTVSVRALSFSRPRNSTLCLARLADASRAAVRLGRPRRTERL